MAGEFYQAAYVSLQYHMGFFMQNKMMPSSRSNMHEIINMLKTLIWEQNARPTMNQVFTFKSAMHAQSFSQILSYNNNEKSAGRTCKFAYSMWVARILAIVFK